ncbi:MAG TPA: tRNA (adenosine(37)-N6)-threonylcarbamoyltransferase complex dimerization subunit type 1 TsaB [Actinopolymorphaceae bacterium]
MSGVVLAIDTATATTVAGLARDGVVLARFAHTDPLRHGEVLVPGIRAMFDEAGISRSDVSLLAVGTGPGPYTGLRVGLATAVGLSVALDVPVDGVCSLDVLSLGVDVAAFRAGVGVVVASDARRREVYWARYDAPGVRAAGPEVSKPAEIATDGPVAGLGPQLYPEAFANAIGPHVPDGGLFAAVVSAGRLERRDLRPIYLRHPDAVAPKARKSALTPAERA